MTTYLCLSKCIHLNNKNNCNLGHLDSSFFKKTCPDFKIKSLKPLNCPHGLKLKELKAFIQDLPDTNSETGEDYEVWIGNNKKFSNVVVEIWPLNVRREGCDILLLDKDGRR